MKQLTAKQMRSISKKSYAKAKKRKSLKAQAKAFGKEAERLEKKYRK